MKDYIVSARKYRPMTFDSVVGQNALTTTLKNAVKSGKIANTYLFLRTSRCWKDHLRTYLC
jgi:DNA polymerase-3 subunit gamma/tau